MLSYVSLKFFILLFLSSFYEKEFNLVCGCKFEAINICHFFLFLIICKKLFYCFLFFNIQRKICKCFNLLHHFLCDLTLIFFVILFSTQIVRKFCNYFSLFDNGLSLQDFLVPMIFGLTV